MNSKVTVIADETTGAVVNTSNNSDYGYVKVQQIRTMIDDNGFLRRKAVSALIPGLLAELKESNFFAGQQLDATIVVEESLTPFNAKTPERDLKIAGETGIVCTLGGLPIYRRTKVSFTNNAQDTLIKHDNVAELKAAYEGQTSKAKTLKPNNDFDLQ
jgi:hypothetical protein